jgi:hypothetical protein
LTLSLSGLYGLTLGLGEVIVELVILEFANLAFASSVGDFALGLCLEKFFTYLLPTGGDIVT